MFFCLDQSQNSTQILNSVRGLNELPQSSTSNALSSSKIYVQEESILSQTANNQSLEKPNQPPPLLPLRPPPIGFTLSVLPDEIQLSDISNEPGAININNNNNINSNSLLSTSTISIQSTSSSSSQEMLNSPNNVPIKGPKPAVPRRPGYILNTKFNKPKSTEDLVDNQNDNTNNTQAPRACSEITSL